MGYRDYILKKITALPLKYSQIVFLIKCLSSCNRDND